MKNHTPSGATDSLPAYVLITPAWNEAQFIEQTLATMVQQTVKPLRWVVVSDGSTDGTDEIVERYSAHHPWIELVRLPKRTERHFSGKVNAFNAGYARVSKLEFSVVGNVDGDTSFDTDHFQYLLGKFAADPRLGVAGTAYREASEELTHNYDIVSKEDPPGACQLFRRECYEEIGGYVPIRIGGIDSVAVYTASMKGWKTQTFTERSFFHHRPVGAGQNRLLAARFRLGEKDYFLGGHPLWELFRTGYHLKDKPYLIGSLLIFSGFFWRFLTRAERPISPELVSFRRKEQMERLHTLLKKKLFRQK